MWGGSGFPGALESADLQEKRLKGFEPSTFCMASRRSSQLSYIRAGADSSLIRRAVMHPALRRRYAGLRPDMRRFGNFWPEVPEISETGSSRRVRAQVVLRRRRIRPAKIRCPRTPPPQATQRPGDPAGELTGGGVGPQLSRLSPEIGTGWPPSPDHSPSVRE
jgi:hypothetical protein